MRIRLTEAELDALNTAAHIAGLPVSSWCRAILRKTALTDAHGAGIHIEL